MHKLMNSIMVVIFLSLLLLSITIFSSLYLQIYSKKFDNQPPTIPQQFEWNGSATEESITTTWISSTDGDGSGVEEYIIYVIKDETPKEYTRVKANEDYKKMRYVIEDLDSNTNYSFEMTAIDKEGNESSPSDITKGTTDKFDDTTPPQKPTNSIVSNITSTTVDLSWDPGTDSGTVEDPASGIKRYDIYPTITHPQSYPIGSTNKDETFITIKDLIPGDIYTLYIYSIDKAGNESNTGEPTNPFQTKLEDNIKG